MAHGKFQRQKGDGYARVQEPTLEPDQARVYSEAIQILNASGIPYILSGAFALQVYTGLWRNTKDLDVFVRPGDLEKCLAALAKSDYETEIREDHWLAKAWKRPYFVDVIFGMANGKVAFDEDFVKSNQNVAVAGEQARLIRLEELVVSKVYIAVRDRFDGGDVLHLIRCAKGKLDWERIIRRLGPYRQVLLWHLILFDFVYPDLANYLPWDIMERLFAESKEKAASPPSERICYGMLLDSFSFEADVKDWSYKDPRQLRPYYSRRGNQS